MSKIVFTGPAFDMMGKGPKRAVLFSALGARGYEVSNTVTKDTALLIASRDDTTKYAKARKLGIPIQTYPWLFEYLGVTGPMLIEEVAG